MSCLATHAHWPQSAPLAAGWPASVDVGLHFNLTEGAPLSPALRAHWQRFPSLSALIMAAHLRRLPLAAIDAELQAQLDAYAAARGAPPDFIDGHQHVHALPGVRRLVLAAARSIGRSTAVRSTGRVIGPGFAVKRWLIAHTGGGAGRALRRRHPAQRRSARRLRLAPTAATVR